MVQMVSQLSTSVSSSPSTGVGPLYFNTPPPRQQLAIRRLSSGPVPVQTLCLASSPSREHELCVQAPCKLAENSKRRGSFGLSWSECSPPAGSFQDGADAVTEGEGDSLHSRVLELAAAFLVSASACGGLAPPMASAYMDFASTSVVTVVSGVHSVVMDQNAAAERERERQVNSGFMALQLILVW